MKTTLKNRIKNITLAAAVAASFVSCESLFEEQGDCDPHYYIKFEYKMHMEKGDAFTEQVEAVDLWIFSKQSGELVDHVYSTVEDLEPHGYLLPINVAPGEYDFVAWCGHKNNRHFKVNETIQRHEHASCRLHKREYDGQQAVSAENLDLLFHGKLDGAKLIDEQGVHIYTIPLIRDVNNISITLQHISGEFDPSHIVVSMNENNGAMNHDNSINESDESILYKPWSFRTGSLNDAEESTPEAIAARSEFDYDFGFNDSATGNFMNIELSTARLMADHNPIIQIADKDSGDTIFQIPVTNWLLQLRSKQYTEMSDQEYLDRKNQHELMVFLQDDGQGGWMAVSVVINGWHIIDNGEYDI